MEPTPLSFAIRLFLDSLFVLFLSIILFAIRGCSPRRYVQRGNMIEQDDKDIKLKALMLGTLVQIFAWNITGLISSIEESQLKAIVRPRDVLSTLLQSMKISTNIPNPKSKEEAIKYLRTEFSSTISDIDLNISLIYGDQIGQIYNLGNLSIAYLLAVPKDSSSNKKMHPNLLMLKNELLKKSNNLNIDNSILEKFLDNPRTEIITLFNSISNKDGASWLDIVEVKPGVGGITVDLKKVATFLSQYWNKFTSNT